ncbi:hypothetical protein BOTBODRAFT_59846 [Botryobasidium botryosum FD-172 SS1]|uniref:Endonuclease V n=1 Tax=Botryobasidium botryosum (strain FD-172 SS1) TaxID=930990 RepID=A0A067LWH3_BOTB1|nr:hypothetical protein BOTBODRAFT_59846 [Botryobasidium botryosum FD-172 SS1]
MSPPLSPELVALKKQWTEEQLALRPKLVFEDSGLSFTVQAPGNLATKKPDDPYKDPRVFTEDYKNTRIEGLRYIGGLDISFVGDDDGTPSDSKNAEGNGRPDAFVTLVVISYPSLQVVNTITQSLHLPAPYIPSFLAYREAPAYASVLAALRTQLKDQGREDQFPQVIMVDGNGRLHARQTGVASVVGFEGDVPTIGVAKNYQPPLAGGPKTSYTYSESDPSVLHWRSSQDGMKEMTDKRLDQPGSWFGVFGADWNSTSPPEDYVGAALRPVPTAKNPIFVSSGHRVSLQTAIHLALALTRPGTRLPEPIQLADGISRKAVAKFKAQNHSRR